MSRANGSADEVHAFVIGFCELFPPWPARHKCTPSCLEGEEHYYGFGRFIGVIAWLVIAKIVQEAFF